MHKQKTKYWHYTPPLHATCASCSLTGADILVEFMDSTHDYEPTLYSMHIKCVEPRWLAAAVDMGVLGQH